MTTNRLTMVILIAGALIVAFLITVTTKRATPLAACRNIPSDASPDLRYHYCQICSTDINIRKQGITELYQYSPVDHRVLLPLLAEIMTTDDYIGHLAGGRSYLAQLAGQAVPSIAGIDAVPTLRHALHSDKCIEIHAGLTGVTGLLAVRGRAVDPHTNKVNQALLGLLPDIHRLTTYDTLESYAVRRAFMGKIAHRAEYLEMRVKQLLPTSTSTE